jgi:hypothetical protein
MATGAALLPHVPRTNVRTYAISSLVSFFSNASIFPRTGPLVVSGLCAPSTRRRISDVESTARTAGLPASRGYFNGFPSPSAEWHVAQTTKNASARTHGPCRCAALERHRAASPNFDFSNGITDSSFTWLRKSEQIRQEAALDGLYVVRTSLSATDLPAEAAVTAYKGLAVVERAFRSLKTVDLQVRPVSTGTPNVCGRMSFCACSPITSSGTCARR